MFQMGCYCSITSWGIKSHPERISNIIRYANNYNWSRLKFPVAINDIGKFEKNNCIVVNVLGIKGQKPYPLRILRYSGQKTVKLLLITDREKRHYTAIKSLSRLLGSSNSKHGHKQHFCLNYFQGSNLEESRDKHYEYCKDNEAV